MIWSILFFGGTFGLATATAYGLCLIHGKPFFNPKDTVEIYEKKLKTIGYVSGVAITQGILLSIYLLHKHINNVVHSWSESVVQMEMYCILVEALYYGYHRLVHCRQLYKKIHSKHHTIVDVYPFDSFYFDILDISALVLSLGLPITVLQMNWIEHFLTMYVYIVSGFLSHSDLYYDHHVKHHLYLNCNYCMFLPIFDIAFGTYR